jgi:hypothetical protein
MTPAQKKILRYLRRAYKTARRRKDWNRMFAAERILMTIEQQQTRCRKLRK